MSSGFGAQGGAGRCFSFWMDLSDCVSKADSPKECKALREDYDECLHHKKEFERRNKIAQEAHSKGWKPNQSVKEE